MQGAADQFPSSPGLASPLLLATTGLTWPGALAAAGQVQRLDAEAVERCNRSEGPPLWLGYANPLQLLSDPDLSDPIEVLERWCQEARWLLSIRQACPERCQLLNLPLLSSVAIADLASLDRPSLQPSQPGKPPEDVAPEPTDLDPRLIVLALQHPSLQALYADLEGCAALHGREPFFQLGLPALRSEAFAARCLESWRQQAETSRTLEELRAAAEQAAADRDEAREEAELTLLQLHQVQEELEHYFLEHRQANQELGQLRQELEELQQEARLLFVHSSPKQGLNRTHLSRIALLMRESLELTGP